MGKKFVGSALEIYDGVSNALKISGLDEKTVESYSEFAVRFYRYIKDRPELQEALKGAKQVYDLSDKSKAWAVAARLESNARAMGAVNVAEKMASRGTISAGGAISTFVEYFAGVAKSLGIEMNECALAITKVILDVLTELALIESVVGIWASALQALAIGADTTDVINACLLPQSSARG